MGIHVSDYVGLGGRDRVERDGSWGAGEMGGREPEELKRG